VIPVGFIRHHLITLALTGVASQLAGTAMVLAAVVSVAASVSEDDASCNCIHGSNAFCPMHRHTKPASPDSRSHDSRWCNGYGTGPDAVLTVLMGFGGPVVSRQTLAKPTGISDSFVTTSANVDDPILPPVSPPPRS